MYDNQFDAAYASESAKYAAKRKKNIMRIVVAVLALLVVSIVIFSAQSFAYFSDSVGSTSNKIEAGNVEIDIVEMMSDGMGGLVSYTDPIRVMPASSVSKIVTVKNSGELAVYVRIALDKTVNDPAGLPAGWEQLISCNINSADWQFVDGYYYYTDVLAPGQTTSPLFDQVRCVYRHLPGSSDRRQRKLGCRRGRLALLNGAYIH